MEPNTFFNPVLTVPNNLINMNFINNIIITLGNVSVFVIYYTFSFHIL